MKGFCLLLLSGLLGSSIPAVASVFNMSEYVPEGSFTIGVEPILTLASKSGIAGNLRYTHGITDMVDGSLTVGTGGGNRRFRLGLGSSIEFFPDTEGQPGVGIGGQAFYYTLLKGSELEFTLVPYVHKEFETEGSRFAPFIAAPFGVAFSDGNYHSVLSVSIGSIFRVNEHLQWVAEVGIAVSNTDTYFSGGIVYTH